MKVVGFLFVFAAVLNHSLPWAFVVCFKQFIWCAICYLQIFKWIKENWKELCLLFSKAESRECLPCLGKRRYLQGARLLCTCVLVVPAFHTPGWQSACRGQQLLQSGLLLSLPRLPLLVGRRGPGEHNNLELRIQKEQQGRREKKQ